MRKIFINYIVLILFILVSCRSSAEPMSTISLEEIKPNKYLNIPIMVNYEVDNDKLIEWNKYLKETYNFEVTYYYQPQIQQEDIANFNGIVFISQDLYAQLFPKRETTFIPLDDFISSKYDGLPNEFVYAFQASDNQVWAIISKDNFTDLPIRQYNMTLLNELGQDVPNDLDSFYNLLLEAKNKLKDLPPLEINRNSILYNLSDILGCFGVTVYRQNYNYFSQVQFSEEQNRFIDITNTTEFLSSIKYIRQLVNEGIIKISDFSDNIINERFYSANILSVYRPLAMTQDDVSNNCEIGYGFLLFNHITQPSEVLPYKVLDVFVLGKNTTNSSELIERILDSFYLNEQGIIESSYGIPTLSTYDIEDNKIILHNDFKIADKFLPLNLSSLYNLLVSNDYAETDSVYKQKLNVEKQYIDFLDQYGLYKPYYKHYIETRFFTDGLYKLSIVLNDVILQYIQDNITEEEFVSIYDKEIEINKLDGIINEINMYYEYID